MRLNMTHITALIELKIKDLMKNMQLMTVPFLSIGIVLLMDKIMPMEASAQRQVLVLGFGIGINVVLGGIIMGAYPIAEEKEHQTLRSLMTAGITGTEFFLGSSIPAFILLLLTNICLISLTMREKLIEILPSFLVLSSIAISISILLGFIIGMMSKTQSQAANYALLPTLGLMMLPSLAVLNESLSEVKNIVYTTPLFNLIENSTVSLLHSLIIMSIWLVVLSLIFSLLYKKNGLDYG